jgi:hypothetical protein
MYKTDQKKEEIKYKIKQDKELKVDIKVKPFKDYNIQKCIDRQELLEFLNIID